MPNEPLRVLVVDDNRDAADSVCQMASLWGHDARAAYDGASALRAAADYRPDVVLCDLGLPDMEGTGVASRLGPGPTLVALTGYTDEAHRRAAAAAGFAHYLVKPVEPEEMRRRLEAVGHTARLARELAAHAQRTADLTDETRRLAAELLAALNKGQALRRGRGEGS